MPLVECHEKIPPLHEIRGKVEGGGGILSWTHFRNFLLTSDYLFLNFIIVYFTRGISVCHQMINSCGAFDSLNRFATLYI